MHPPAGSPANTKPNPSFAVLGRLANANTTRSAPKAAKRITPADFRKGADVFKALGNANRLLIVDALTNGERCVADLTDLVGLDMSTVSNHLAVLRSVGLVTDERRGTQVFYSLRNPCVMNIFCCLDDFHATNDPSGHL
jgi:DNA-binding transcriptional ArsR family regulator